jgi:hypothetical protein
MPKPPARVISEEVSHSPEDHPIIKRIFADIKATKKIERIPNIWRGLAAHPAHLEMC